LGTGTVDLERECRSGEGDEGLGTGTVDLERESIWRSIADTIRFVPECG
jgi:hypothetical protein